MLKGYWFLCIFSICLATIAFATGSYARRSTKWNKPERQVMAKVVIRKFTNAQLVIWTQFPVINRTTKVIQWLRHQGQWISSSNLWCMFETHSLTSLKIEVVVMVKDADPTQRAKIRSDSIFILDHFVVWTKVRNAISVLEWRVVRYNSLYIYVRASTSATGFVLKDNFSCYRSCLNFFKFLLNSSICFWRWRWRFLFDLNLIAHFSWDYWIWLFTTFSIEWKRASRVKPFLLSPSRWRWRASWVAMFTMVLIIEPETPIPKV